MHQPGYCSVVFGVLRDFGDAGQAIGWRKMKFSTDRNMRSRVKVFQSHLSSTLCIAVTLLVGSPKTAIVSSSPFLAAHCCTFGPFMYMRRRLDLSNGLHMTSLR